MLTKQRVHRRHPDEDLRCQCGAAEADTEEHRYWRCPRWAFSRSFVTLPFETLPYVARTTGIFLVETGATLDQAHRLQQHLVRVGMGTAGDHLPQQEPRPEVDAPQQVRRRLAKKSLRDALYAQRRCVPLAPIPHLSQGTNNQQCINRHDDDDDDDDDGDLQCGYGIGGHGAAGLVAAAAAAATCPGPCRVSSGLGGFWFTGLGEECKEHIILVARRGRIGHLPKAVILLSVFLPMFG